MYLDNELIVSVDGILVIVGCDETILNHSSQIDKTRRKIPKKKVSFV